MPFSSRERIIFIFFLLFFLTIFARLGWWQIGQRQELLRKAKAQEWHKEKPLKIRGEITFFDGHPLALSKIGYQLHIFKPELTIDYQAVAEKLAQLKEKNKEEEKERIVSLLESDSLWLPIWHQMGEEEKERIENLKIKGLRLDREMVREYPESSQAAHLVGFLGKNKEGEDQGYFGLEGYYDDQLKKGVNLKLFLDRQIQWLTEEEIERGVKKYGAKRGLVLVVDPKTGGILSLAVYPRFNPKEYSQTDTKLFLNPAISETIEPGSIFKPLIMAAAIDSGRISPDERCTKCDGPRKIGDKTIHTFNDEYYPQSTMTDIIKHSDNVGMVYVIEKLGLKKTLNYLEKFGFGQTTNVDLQGEITNPLDTKKYWPFIDLATVSFGQGIAVTPMQIIQAFTALANKGKMVSPRAVAEISYPSGKKVKPSPQEKIVLSPKTAAIVTQMMIAAVEDGFVKKLVIPGLTVAGKTGTAQIAIGGQYDPHKTIASFIGFAPAENPRFLMLTVLYQPSASPWGTSTAAPVWFNIARRIMLTKNIY